MKSVLFQDKPSAPATKPKISETDVSRGDKSFSTSLPFQSLLEFQKPLKKSDLPADYAVDEELFTTDRCSVRKTDVTWSLARLDLTTSEMQGVSLFPSSQSMPSWSASQSVWTEEDLPVKSVGFIPVLPFPVTQYDSVFTAMKNLQGILQQLQQSELPMFCDEKVYCMVKEIQMLRRGEFGNLVPMLGTFHMLKVLLRCTGRYLQGSGASHIWLESGVFGPTVIENSILNGTHYLRSSKGMELLAEAMQRLRYAEFFKEKGILK